MQPIAHIKTDLPAKFGIPRQSGVVPSLKGKIIFEPQYRNANALRGLDGFSHLWIIWQFSANKKHEWQPLVRPPRLGGNSQIGVFASRSPYRPNAIGLSVVKIEDIQLYTEEGPIIIVSGIDMMDNTPIFDIKPYVNYADCIPNARSGFVDNVAFRTVDVIFPDNLKSNFSAEQITTLIDILYNDPRPSYHSDSNKIYGMLYANHDVHFKVENGILTVIDVK